MKSFGPKTILYPTPVLVVGTYDAGDTPNIMTAAWGGICCSKPPCVTVSLRQATYTYGNLMEHKAYTLNIPSKSQVREADYAGIYSGKNQNKFDVLGLSPVRADKVHAPYVAEFPVVLECKVIQTVEIGLHTQFIGEVMDVKVREDCLDSKGKPDMDRIQPLAFLPEIREYVALGETVAKAFSAGRELSAGDE